MTFAYFIAFAILFLLYYIFCRAAAIFQMRHAATMLVSCIIALFFAISLSLFFAGFIAAAT